MPEREDWAPWAKRPAEAPTTDIPINEAAVERPASPTAAVVELELLEERFRRVLAENAALCKEIEVTRRELEQSRHEEEELSATWKATTAVNMRQKMAIQGLAKNVQAASRAESTRLLEAAQQVQEMQDVYKRLQSVNRQLKFAQDMQAQALALTENKLTSRGHRIRKLEQALFRLIYEGQSTPGLEGVVAGLVAKCGPMVRSVLAREAQRQALEITAKDLPHEAQPQAADTQDRRDPSSPGSAAGITV